MESENTKLGGDSSELISLTWWSRALTMSSKVGKTASSILARTQAILLNNLGHQEALKQCLPPQQNPVIQSVTTGGPPTCQGCTKPLDCGVEHPGRAGPGHPSKVSATGLALHMGPCCRHHGVSPGALCIPLIDCGDWRDRGSAEDSCSWSSAASMTPSFHL